MAITLYIGVELDATGLRSFKKSKVLEHFEVYSKDIEQWGTDLSSRFLGHSLSESRLIKRIWDAKPGSLSGSLEGLRVFRLPTANSVLVAKLRFDSQSYEEVSKYRKLSSQQLKGILRGYELESLLVTGRSVYPVIGTITDIGDPWEPMINSGWVHLQGDFVESKLLEQIVSRVAIERSILSWAVGSSSSALTRVIQPARALGLIRRWPVELLTDRLQISENYKLLRHSLNLHAVRAEVIERAKDWWNVVGVSAGALGLIAAIFGLYL